MSRSVNLLLAARAAIGLVALQAAGCGGGCGGRSSGGGGASIQSRAASESCVLPTDGRPAAAYQAAITTFLGGSCYASWQHDPSPRLTGRVVDGATYSVHDYIKVFYSPSLVTWMQANRPATGVSPSTVATMPQDAAIVAEIYPSATAPTPSGRLVMTRQTAAPAAARPASGWFFSQIVTDASHWRATSLTTSVGDYSLGQCIGCHASAVDNFTYVSTSNLLGQTLQLADWKPSFPSPSTTDLPAPVTPPASRQLRRPLDDAAAQQFIDFYNRAVPEFQANNLPAAAQLPSSKVLALPPRANDDFYLRAGQPSFVTSGQCKGCHDASALLSVQSGGQHTWAAPQMSFKHPTGWGDTQPPADRFNLSPYGEWSVSIMALAARDPVFLAQVETERVLHAGVTPTAIDNFCFRCHGPMGQRQFHRDNGGDPTQFPPDKQPAPQGNFSHYMLYLPPGGCTDTTKFPCNQPGMTPANAKYGTLARDGISCAMCHHIGPAASGPPRPDPWSVLYGFKNPAIAAAESPLGIAYPFTGSVGYDLTQFVAPPKDALTIGYVGNNNAEIWGHQQSFNATTLKDDSLPQGEFCGGCHVVIAPAIPIQYPQVRNMDQINPDGTVSQPARYPGTNQPCPDVSPGPDGKYDPTTDPCVKQAYEQTTYLEWAASATFGGSTGRQASCTYCHMPLASSTDTSMSIANTETPGNTAGVGGLPPVAFRADQKLTLSANAGYPRHRLMAINLFVHEMFQQFPNILGIAAEDATVPPDTVLNLQNAEETILSHAPTTVALSVCTPGSADQSCKDVQGDASSLTYQVTVANLSGHRFPTGAGFRRGFLEFRLLDASDRTLWVSGAVNAQGAIVDGSGNVLATEFPPMDRKYQASFLQPHFGTSANPAITRQDQVQIYEVRSTDEYGKLTTATTRLFGSAKENRIPPPGWIPPYDCSGARTPATAQPGTMVKGLDQFALSRITAPDGLQGTGDRGTIEPGSPYSDPDYCTPGRDRASGIAGVDRVLYRIPKAALGGQKVAKVKVVMHYQAIPPYFLRDRFLDGRQAKAGEGGAVGLGAATERLLHVTSRLDMNIDNTIPDQGNLPKQVARNWTMDIGTACLPADANCAPPQLSGERMLLRDVYDRQGVIRSGGAKRK